MALVECPFCGKHSLVGNTNCVHCGKKLNGISENNDTTNTPKETKIEFDEDMVYYCDDCYNTGQVDSRSMKYKGYFIVKFNFGGLKSGTCPVCGGANINTTNMTAKDYISLANVSKEIAFFEAMMKLKESDIIEFESKMVPFRMQEQSENQKKAEIGNAIKCPKCGSTSITTGARGVNNFWGFMGASKTVNRCAKCGNAWTPRT